MKIMYLVLKFLGLRLYMKIAKRNKAHIERRLSETNARQTAVSCKIYKCESELRQILFRELQPLHQDESKSASSATQTQEGEESQLSRPRENPVWTQDSFRAVDGY